MNEVPDLLDPDALMKLNCSDERPQRRAYPRTPLFVVLPFCFPLTGRKMHARYYGRPVEKYRCLLLKECHPAAGRP